MPSARFCTLLVIAIHLLCYAPASDSARSPGQAEPYAQANKPVGARQKRSVDDLATLLADATEEERRALLAQEKEMITPELQKALIRQGDRLFRSGSYPQALAIYELALDIAGRLSDTTGSAVSLRSIGNIYYYRRAYDQALNYYLESLKLAEESDSKVETSRTLNSVGSIFYAQGRHKEALEYYEKSLRLAEELNNRAEVARALNNLGNVCYSRGDYTQALDYYRRSSVLKNELNDKGGVSITLFNLGQVLYQQGNYTSALDHYAKSLSLAEEMERKAGIASILRAVADVYSSQGNYIQAATNYLRSHKLAQEMGDKAGMAATLLGVGQSLYSEGNYAGALEYYRKGLTTAEESSDAAEVVRAVNGIGLAYQSQGDYNRALDSYRKTYSLLKGKGSKVDLVSALRSMGNMDRSLGNYTQAAESYHEALRLAEGSGLTWLTAPLLNDLGDVYYSQGSYAQAIETSARAARLAEQADDSKSYSGAEMIAGKSYQALNKLDQADQAFLHAIRALKESRGEPPAVERERDFFADKLAPYNEMIALKVMQNKAAEAFSYAEMAKGQTLFDLMQGRMARVTRAMAKEEQEKEQAYDEEILSLRFQIYRKKLRQAPDDKVQLSDLMARLKAVRMEYEAFKNRMFAAHPQLKNQRGEIRPFSVQEAAPLLRDKGSALLEFVVTEQKTFLFVLTKSERVESSVELEVYTVKAGRQELAFEVKNFRESLIKQSPDFSKSAMRLYDLLLKPARKHLEGKSTLCIVPDNVLWGLPFQALQPKEGRYLSEDHAVFYALSLAALRDMSKRDTNKVAVSSSNHDKVLRQAISRNVTTATGPQTSMPALLGFANPTAGEERDKIINLIYGAESTPAVEAEAEVKALGQLYDAMGSKTLVGADICEDGAKAEIGNYSAIHFATPGVMDDNSPMNSHLLVSGDGCGVNEDGMLKASEVLKLDLRADVIVLSRCRTAYGRSGGGEGIIAMTWAFWVAGCPAVIVSQWRVDSASTTQFMLEFYRKINIERRDSKDIWSKAEAMHSAELKLLKSNAYHHPFHWARFMLVGGG